MTSSLSGSSDGSSAGPAVVVAMRTRSPRAISRGTASTTLAKLSGPRAMSLTSGRCESREICNATLGWANLAARSRRSPENSVPLVSRTSGRCCAISSTASGSHGNRNGSPPVTPSAVNPSSVACSATATICSALRIRRSLRGEDSVRQYEQARLQW